MSRIVAIDGPAGSGKSTVARLLAERLGIERLDTGAMYRAVTLLVLESKLSPSDGVAAADLAKTMSLSLGERAVVNGRDVTAAIRSPAVDAAVSEVAAHPSVRAELLERQRAWAQQHGGGVVEGRDIGSVVFPDADVKVHLTAHPNVRAARRVAERSEAPGEAAALGELAEIARRDERDSRRATSPLLVAEGAIVVDSSELTAEEVVEEVLGRL